MSAAGHAASGMPLSSARAKCPSHSSRSSGGALAESARVSLVRASRYANPAARRIGRGSSRSDR